MSSDLVVADARVTDAQVADAQVADAGIADATRRSDQRTLRTRFGGSAFPVMWTGAALSYCGDGVVLAAGPLAAAALTSDPRLISGLTVAATLPWAMFCLLSGAVVDRVDRIRLMWRIDLFRGVPDGRSGALVRARHAQHLSALPGLLLPRHGRDVLHERGAGDAAHGRAAAQAALCERQAAVGRDRPLQLAGPPLGGLLFAVAASLPFLVDSISYLLSSALLLLIRRLPRRSAPVAPAGDPVPWSRFRRPRATNLGASAATPRRAALSSPDPEPLRSQIAQGLAWLWRHPQLRMLAVFTGLTNLLTEATLSVLVIFSRDELGLPEIGSATCWPSPLSAG